MTGKANTVVVVGGGLAGLTAAATAARAGAEVTLLEAREHDGGRARTRSVEGFLLNQGAHALYRGGPAWDILAGLGVAPRGRAPDASKAYGLPAGSELGVMPSTLGTMVASRLLSAGAKLEVARLFARPERLAATVQPATSMQQWIAQRLRRPDARAFLATGSRVATYCGDLDGLDAAAGVAQLVHALRHGVVYLDGGWQQLVDALRDVGRAAGTRARVGAKVAAVEDSASGVVVRTPDGDLDADAVVIANGGPCDADAILHGTSREVSRCAAEEQPVYVAALDVALRALPVPRRRIVLGLDEPVYLSVHTPYAQLVRSEGREGGEVVHLLWYGETDCDPRPRLESLLDRAQPGWRGLMVAQRYGRRLVVAHGRPRPGLGMERRPTSRVPDLQRVFVAGDWVGPQGLLADAALASARAAGDAAARVSREVVTT
jgi:phytoene dehydrogenase-like protein